MFIPLTPKVLLRLMLQRLRLYHFKNYLEAEFGFTTPVVCLYGLNGCGKTNLLDAIYLLCFTRSYFHTQDGLLRTDGEKGMRVDGILTDDRPHEIAGIWREDGRKSFQCDGQAYERFSDHLGRFPAVFVSPDDTRLISDGSEGRRQFLDTMISQTDKHYLTELIQYTRILKQRNEWLKQYTREAIHDYTLLDIYSRQLHESGQILYEKRKQFCSQYTVLVQSYYKQLSGEQEDTGILYQSALHESTLIQLLNQSVDTDLQLGYTRQGIHRDDLYFSLQNRPMKSSASQGQRKSFLFSLKLAQYELLCAGHVSPILLLDDLFEKLDEERSRRLITLIQDMPGQVFITDTHLQRLQHAFRFYGDRVSYLALPQADS